MASMSTQRSKYFIVLCLSFLPIFSLMVIVFFTSFRPLFVNLENIVEKNLREIRPVHMLQMSLLKAVMPPHDHLIHGFTEERQLWESAKHDVNAAFSRALHASPLSPVREELSALQKEWHTASENGDSLFREILENRLIHPLAEEIEAFDDRVIDITLRLNNLIDRMDAESLDLYNQIHRLKIQGLFQSLGAILTGFVFGAAGTVWLTRDRKKMEARSLSDPLTGILNRRALEGELHRLHNNKSAQYAVLMMDLDHFKQINDTLGHAAGDTALKHFTRITKQSIRGSDIFGRYGGEEFLLILPGTRRQEALAMAERIRKSLSSTPVSLAETQRKITVSIGQAACPEDAPDAAGVLRAADAAMYRAKAQGRNQVVCPDESGLSIRTET